MAIAVLLDHGQPGLLGKLEEASCRRCRGPRGGIEAALPLGRLHQIAGIHPRHSARALDDGLDGGPDSTDRHARMVPRYGKRQINYARLPWLTVYEYQ